MATYHLRVKDDTKRSGSKVSPTRHADYILREKGIDTLQARDVGES